MNKSRENEPNPQRKSEAKKPVAARHPVTIKTMFYTEGATLALIVTNVAGRRTKEHIAMTTAEAALAWYKANVCNLAYSAFDITKA